MAASARSGRARALEPGALDKPGQMSSGRDTRSPWSRFAVDRNRPGLSKVHSEQVVLAAAAGAPTQVIDS